MTGSVVAASSDTQGVNGVALTIVIVIFVARHR